MIFFRVFQRESFALKTYWIHICLMQWWLCRWWVFYFRFCSDFVWLYGSEIILLYSIWPSALYSDFRLMKEFRTSFINRMFLMKLIREKGTKISKKSRTSQWKLMFDDETSCVSARHTMSSRRTNPSTCQMDLQLQLVDDYKINNSRNSILTHLFILIRYTERIRVDRSVHVNFMAYVSNWPSAQHTCSQLVRRDQSILLCTHSRTQAHVSIILLFIINKLL